MEDNKVFYKFSIDYSDTFNNYWNTAEYTDDKLKCFNVDGWSTEEYTAILKAILKQFTFDKKIKDDEEFHLENDFYQKDELLAKCSTFEITFLSICLK